MRTISREALFKDAWTRPLAKIAAEFGVSDTALRKACDRHDIPTPGRGYWAQVASGKSFPRPALRPAKTPDLETVRIVGAVQPPPEVKALIERVKAERPAASKPEPAKAEAEPTVQAAPAAPEPSTEMHTRAQRTHAKLVAAQARGSDIIHLSGKGLFTVAASPASADRIGRVLSLLIQAMGDKGWALEDGDKGLRLIPDGEAIGVEITELTDRVRHEPTEAEQRALAKFEERRDRAARRREWFSEWERPKIPEWDSVPNGQLVLSLAEGMRHEGMRRKFSDGKTQRLETLIAPILESLAIYAASEKAWRDRVERQRLEAIDAEKRRVEVQRRQTLEEKRLAFLKHQMQRHQRALEVEAFVADTRAAGAVDGVVAAFLAWADDYAAALRADISPEALREKLTQLDLMNDAATVSSWAAVDHPLDPPPPAQRDTYSPAPAPRQQYPFWLKHRR